MEIERKALDFLKKWKTRSTRKPLIVRGARQVGKTKLIRDLFGAREFASVVETMFTDVRGNSHPFHLLSLPFYLCNEAFRLAEGLAPSA